MENAVLNDSVRLARNILRKSSPNEQAFPISITKSNDDYIQPFGSLKYPVAFGYKESNTPSFLEGENITEGLYQGAWYVRKAKVTKSGKQAPKTITQLGWDKGYLDKKLELQVEETADEDMYITYTCWAIREKLTAFLERNKDVVIPDEKSTEIVTYIDDVLEFPVPGMKYPIQIDFKGTRVYKALMRTLWELRQKNPGKVLFGRNEIAELYDSKPYEKELRLRGNAGNFQEWVLASRPLLTNRFIFEYDKPSDKWHFEIKDSVM